jgi:hypothetical protein
LNFENNDQEEQIFEKASKEVLFKSDHAVPELDTEFLDNSYWRIGAEKEQTLDIDSLINDLAVTELKVKHEFLDNTYWRIGAEKNQNLDIDSLFAELEGF